MRQPLTRPTAFIEIMVPANSKFRHGTFKEAIVQLNLKSFGTHACGHALLSAVSAFTLLLILPGTIQAQTVKVTYTFTGQGASAYPGSVIPAQGRDAKLYGTAQGQATSFGEDFRLSTTRTFSG